MRSRIFVVVVLSFLVGACLGYAFVLASTAAVSTEIAASKRRQVAPSESEASAEAKEGGSSGERLHESPPASKLSVYVGLSGADQFRRQRVDDQPVASRATYLSILYVLIPPLALVALGALLLVAIGVVERFRVRCKWRRLGVTISIRENTPAFRAEMQRGEAEGRIRVIQPWLILTILALAACNNPVIEWAQPTFAALGQNWGTLAILGMLALLWRRVERLAKTEYIRSALTTELELASKEIEQLKSQFEDARRVAETAEKWQPRCLTAEQTCADFRHQRQDLAAVVQSWLDKQGQDRCHYPEVFAEAEEYGVGKDGEQSLTIAELVAACAHFGVDLTCGACAEIFYTGLTGLTTAQHTCSTQANCNPPDLCELHEPCKKHDLPIVGQTYSYYEASVDGTFQEAVVEKTPAPYRLKLVGSGDFELASLADMRAYWRLKDMQRSTD